MNSEIHGQYAKVGNDYLFLSRVNLKTLRPGLEAMYFQYTRSRITKENYKKAQPTLKRFLKELESLDTTGTDLYELIEVVEHYIDD